jgi:abhydrolase domain-containing protein 17
VLVPEYPGYSVYPSQPGKADLIMCQDLNAIFDFLVSRGFSESRIIVMGRSIGSGPSCYIAKNRHPGALILISPFTSLQNAAKNMFGNLCGCLVRERFNNLECIDSVTCPVMILHGRQDMVVPLSHAEQLFRKKPFYKAHPLF